MRKLLALFASTLLIATPALADKNYIGKMATHSVTAGEDLPHLAKQYDFGYVEIRAANPDVTNPWSPKAGSEIVLPSMHLLPDAPHDGIVINLPEMRLYTFFEKDNPKTFPIGVGRDGLETPTGKAHIRAKTKGPVWRPTKRMREENPDLPEVVPAGKENPLGTHALYLSWPEYAIHGTAKPFGIGRRVSSGCIRLYPEDIPRLYKMTKVGTNVQVVNQPIKSAWIDDDFYIEVSPTMEQSYEVEANGKPSTSQVSADDWERLNKNIGDKRDEINWLALRQAISQARGYPINVSISNKN